MVRWWSGNPRHPKRVGRSSDAYKKLKWAEIVDTWHTGAWFCIVKVPLRVQFVMTQFARGSQVIFAPPHSQYYSLAPLWIHALWEAIWVSHQCGSHAINIRSRGNLARSLRYIHSGQELKDFARTQREEFYWPRVWFKVIAPAAFFSVRDALDSAFSHSTS